MRDAVVTYLEGRCEAIHNVNSEVVKWYVKSLSKGRYWEGLDENKGFLHNQINKRLYEAGFGISQVQEKIDAIRFLMQDYFEKFNPVKQRSR